MDSLEKHQIVWVQHVSHNEDEDESKLHWPGMVHKVQNNEICIKIFGSGKNALVFHPTLVLGDWKNTRQQEIIDMHFNEYGRLNERTWNKWNKSVKLAMEEEERRKDLNRINKQREIEEKQREKEYIEEQDKKKKMSGLTYDGREEENEEFIGFILHAGDTIQYYPEAMMIGNTHKNITNNNDNNYDGIITKIIRIGDLYEIQKLEDVGPIQVENWTTPPFFDTEILLIKSKYYTQHQLDYIETNNIYYALKKCRLEIGHIASSIDKEREKDFNKFRNKMEKNGWGSMLYLYPSENRTETKTRKRKRKMLQSNDNKNDEPPNKKLKK